MAAKRRGLGRNLDALLGGRARQAAPVPEAAGNETPGASAAAPPPVAATPGTREGLRTLDLDLIQPGRYQPRQDMHAESLQELADSIRAQGLVQPIVVRPLPGGEPSGVIRYEIVAGERRWRAAQLAGLEEIPAVVREIPDSAAIAVALIENIQRENLNPLEEAQAVRRLVDEFELTHQQAADAIGRSRTAVTNLLRLLELGPETRQLVESGELEMGHARALLALVNARQQAEVAALVARKGLSVRETEQLVRRLLGQKPPAAKRSLDPDVRRLQDDLAARLGAKVRIQHSAAGRGKLVIDYNSLDELDGILAHIK